MRRTILYLVGSVAIVAILTVPSFRSPEATKSTVSGEDESCPQGVMYQSAAEGRALSYASGEGFSQAAITSSALMPREEAEELYDMNIGSDVACVWYVDMSGSKPIPPRPYPTGMTTPTPGAWSIFVELELAMNALNGYVITDRYATVPLTTPSPYATWPVLPTYQPRTTPPSFPPSTPTSANQ